VPPPSRRPPTAPPLRRFRRAALGLLALVVLAAGIGGTWGYRRLRASLPRLDGRAALPGLDAAVTVTRDALGVPVVRGASRIDVARATGYLHAQDRFFQMDLLRRRAAGELAALLGPAAVPADRAARIHRFRSIAERSLAQADPADRALLAAYAAGVNAGLAALREVPFEYLILRTPPQPWRPEDSCLVGFAMTLDLEDDRGAYLRSLAEVRDELGSRVLAFFAPLLSPGDAALDGSSAPLPPIPSAADLDLRRPVDADAPDGGGAGASASAGAGPGSGPTVTSWRPARPPATEPDFPGSNGFALSGAHAAGGAGLLASDMHLHLGVPNVWYRASLEWPGHRVTGVLLPGVPYVLAGSNGRVAWGFTDGYVATGDLVIVAPGPTPDQYHGPGDRLLPFALHRDFIAVKGAAAVPVESRWTVWGPIVGPAPRGRFLAYRWVAHDPAAANLLLGRMETAETAGAAMAVAHRAGMPAQNLIVADAAGSIGWTIAGRLPRRVGYDGRNPVSYLFGDRSWAGLLPPDQVPTIANPADGRIWTANNRVVGGTALALLGDAGYARGARAAQIRDDLGALIARGQPATPRDLLAIQLDDRALFLARWQALLMDVLSPAALAGHPARAQLRTLAATWEGRASIASVSYGLVRDFRQAAAARALDPIFAPCLEADPEFDWRRFHCEDGLWTLLHAQPAHLLAPPYSSWSDLLLAAVDDTAAKLARDYGDPARATWGRRNLAHLVHPLARALPAWLPPWLTGWLDLPREPLPGDIDMPRVQGPEFGASERFVVAPGREEEGIFHMPGGQSGHPLSPFYRAGHAAWARGEPTPFLPGAPAHTLLLTPQ
jgi:penicillin amidase